MKKVIISVTNDLATDQRVIKTAQLMASMQFNVTMVGRKKPGSLPFNPSFCKTKRFKLIFNKKFLFYAEYNIRLFLYLLFRKADLYVANDLDTLLANHWAAKIKNKKLIYDSHEFFIESPEIIHKPFIQKTWKFIESTCIKGIDAGITVSQPIADYHKATYNKDFIVVRNIPGKIIKNKEVTNIPGFLKYPNIILYQGYLNIGRGLEVAINAFRYIEDAKLVIVGSGDIEEKLKNMVNELKLENKVFFTGRISPAKLNTFTYKATIGISIEEKLGKNYEYALPNKLFNYIQAGVPVIISDLPEMRKVVEKYKVGAILKEHNAENLANLIKDIITHPTKHTVWKKNCIVAAKELCWEKESIILRDVIKKHI